MVWDIERHIFSIGSFELRWYSLLFAGGIFAGYHFVRRVFINEGRAIEPVDQLLVYIVIGTIVGARLGHCLLYEPHVYLSDPIRILRIWEGGLASHGGYLGVMIAIVLFCRKHRDISFFGLADRVAPAAMMAAGCIRLGNFFNSEIIGRETDLPWGVVFKKIDDLTRHPTQIYESAGYFTISAILYLYYRSTNRNPREGAIFGLVMILAYSFRFAVEFLKEHQVSFEQTMTFNMGQMLSIPFVLAGFYFFVGAHRNSSLWQWGLARAEKSQQVGDGDQGGAAPPRKRRRRRKRR